MDETEAKCCSGKEGELNTFVLREKAQAISGDNHFTGISKIHKYDFSNDHDHTDILCYDVLRGLSQIHNLWQFINAWRALNG